VLYSIFLIIGAGAIFATFQGVTNVVAKHFMGFRNSPSSNADSSNVHYGKEDGKRNFITTLYVSENLPFIFPVLNSFLL